VATLTPKAHIPSIDMGKVENSLMGGWSEMTEYCFVVDVKGRKQSE